MNKTSDEFLATGSTFAQTPRALRLPSPLTSDFDDTMLSPSAVTLSPDILLPGVQAFRLEVDPTGYPAAGYSGTVEVHDALHGGVIESVAVWIGL